MLATNPYITFSACSRKFSKKSETMGIRGFLQREFSFISGNYGILIVSWVIMDLAMEMPVPNFQYYVQALGGTGLALGIIGLANFLAMAAVALPGGYLADKYGRRWLISTMTFGLALSYIFFAIAPTWHFILIGQVVQSLCLIYQPALFAMVQDSLPEERRGVGSSLIQMIHGTFNTPGPIVAGLLLLEFGLILSMRIVYFVVVALFLVAAIWRLRLKESIKTEESIEFRNVHIASSEHSFSLITYALLFIMSIVGVLIQSHWWFLPGCMFGLLAITTLVERWRAGARLNFARVREFLAIYPRSIRECCINVWKTVPSSVLWLFLVQVIFMFANAQVNVINAIYARDQLGIPEDLWWLTFIPMLVTMMVASVPIGKTIDRIGPKKPLLLGPLVLASALLLFVRGNFVTIMISMCLNGIVFLLIMSSAMTLTAYLVEPLNRGKVRGFLSFMGYIFTGIGMLLGNFLYDLVPQIPFYLALGLTVPMALVILFHVPGSQKQNAIPLQA